MGNLFDWFGGNSSNSSATQTKLNKLEKEIETIKKNVSNKVDKVNGKGLSTNDFTNEYKDKVDGLVTNPIEVIGGDEDTTEIINNVEVDASLTKEGCAADAKATGKKFEEVEKNISQNESSILKEVKEYINSLNLTSEETPTIVTPTGDNTDYVTPQMFGAKANGYTDDTEAVQAALDSGKSVFFPHGDYYVTKPIIITNKKFWSMDARGAIISYDGDDFAVKILNVCNCCISIGCVYTQTGGGIEFYSDSKGVWNQYVTLHFDFIMAKTDCIKAETSGEGWSNENQIYGGQFASGENGVHFTRKDGVHGLNGWKFYNCGVEGVINGFLFDAGDGEICNNVIVNPRYAESFETALITKGTVYDCKWIAPTPMMPSYIKASPKTTRFIIDAPIGTYWHMHDTAYIRGVIMDGKLMGERPTYETIE